MGNIIKNLIGISLCLFIYACGGGGSEDKSPGKNLNSPSPYADLTKIHGQWYIPVTSNCIEEYNFNQDGTFSFLSNEQEGSGNYIIKEDENSQKLTLELTRQSNALDCEGSVDSYTGIEIELYVSYPSEVLMDWKEQAQSSFNIGRFERNSNLSFINLPEQVNSGDLITVNISHDYTPEYEIAFGPDGLSFENKKISWQATPLPLDDNMQVEFGLKVKGGVLVYPASLKVNVKDHTSAKSLAFLDSSPSNLLVADVDDLPGNEIIYSEEQHIGYAKWQNNKLQALWEYSYQHGASRTQAIAAVAKHNSDKSNIAFATDSGIYLIDSFDQKAKLVFQHEGEIQKLKSADIDSDGHSDLVFLSHFGENNYTTKIVGYSLAKQQILNTYIVSGRLQNMQIGQLDSDVDLEVLAQDGTILKTDNSHYKFHDAFSGFRFKLSDLNNDGIDEIVGGNIDGDNQIYDLHNQETLHIFPYNTPDDVQLIGNFDADAEKEILLKRANSRFVILDFVEQKWQYSMEITSSQVDQPLLFADITGNQQLELIYRHEDRMLVLAEFAPNLPTLWSLPDYNFGFKGTYTSQKQISPEQIKPIAKTRNHAFTVPFNGEAELFSEIEQLAQFNIGDTNGDGYAEQASFPYQHNEDFKPLTIRDIESQQIIYQKSYQENSPIEELYLEDLNNDGSDEVIFTTRENLYIQDTNLEFETKIHKLRSTDIIFYPNNLGEQVIAIARGQNGFTTVNHTKKTTNNSNVKCTSIDYLTSSNRLLCLHPEYQYNTEQFVTSFSLLDTDLFKNMEFQLVGDFRACTQKEGSDNIQCLERVRLTTAGFDGTRVKTISLKSGFPVMQSAIFSGSPGDNIEWVEDENPTTTDTRQHLIFNGSRVYKIAEQ